MRTADSSLTGKDPQPRPGDQVGVEPEAVRDQLAHILASPEFKAADRNRRFLRYVVEEALAGRGDRIKAYNVAVGVFGRDTGFDPQTDPIVRIEASRLRRSLEHYYIVAGQDDRVRIEIPKGGYVPVFGYAAGCSTKHESAPPEPASALAARDEEPPILAHRGEARASPSAVPASLSSSWHIPTSAAGLSMALGLLMTVALGLGLWFSTADGPDAVAGASNPSIIVLPFESLSAEPAGDNLAKGITDEITIGLEQFQELFVYAPETGARFTPGAGYEQVHWDLGVRYILEGSVRQNQDVVRVTARLIDATSGVQLWASAYEKAGRSADALFRLQSDIARAVVGELAQPFGVIAIADLQLIREKPPETLSAYECVLQVVHYYRHMSPERVETARNCLERATASEPNYADAWAMLSMNYLDQVRLRMVPVDADKALLDQALHAAQRALELAPRGTLGHRAIMLARSFRGEVELAAAAGERAIALNPNNSDLLAEHGQRLALMGEWERGVALIDKAIALNPAHSGWYHTAPALNLYRQGRYAEALERAKMIDAPQWIHNHVVLAMIHGQLGQKAEAEACVRRILEMDPAFGRNVWHELALRNIPGDVAEHMIDGLRKAGLSIPEQRPRVTDPRGRVPTPLRKVGAVPARATRYADAPASPELSGGSRYSATNPSCRRAATPAVDLPRTV